MNMLKEIMENGDGESGVVMIEAVYVVVIAVLIIFFTINVGVIYHNRIITTSAANESANGVAEVYGCTGAEPFYAYVSPEYFKGRDVYRYLFDGKNKLNSTAVQKGKWYAGYLISELEFSAEHNMDFSDVTVCCEKNDIGAQTISVTIKREYPVFIINPASFWGLDPRYNVEAVGTAVCYDIIHQMNAVSFVHEIEDTADGMTALTSILDTILDIIDKLRKGMVH
jgi:hypothetical protein